MPRTYRHFLPGHIWHIDPKTVVEPPMNADESVSFGRRLIHCFGDGYEMLLRLDFSAFIGVYRRQIVVSGIEDEIALTMLAHNRKCGRRI